MVRSMYSGVAGMKANQSRMDVIGNNISNSNTYGFKSSRATFRDMYYQQLKGASAGTQTRGGVSPSMVGYGAQLSSVDLLMTQSSMTSTGNPLDIAITGEGFLQVMDPDGNIYYTKAGMLDIDAATGAVIDSNGNFVLGTGATNGKLDSTTPGSNKIFIQVDPVQASVASVEKEVSGRMIRISSTEQVKDANISFTFTKSTSMPDGQFVQAIMDGTTSVINIQLNANETFESVSQLNNLINDAITDAYGGQHPGGSYSFEFDPDPFTDGGLTGAEIIDVASSDYEGGGVEVAPGGTVTLPGGVDASIGAIDANGRFLNGFKFNSIGSAFSGAGEGTIQITKNAATADAEESYTITFTTAGDPNNNNEGAMTYTGTITKNRADASTGGNTIKLEIDSANSANQGRGANDYIVFSYPNTTNIEAVLGATTTGGTTTPAAGGATASAVIGTATAQEPTRSVGLGKGTFTLEGGTAYTTQDISDLTGISIGPDGTIMGTSEAGLQVLGRIDLAAFGNAAGLMQSGNSYFVESANSGAPRVSIAGENGTGAIKNSSLEMSNVDLSQEFSDMIVTQRGFQACSRLITVSDTMLEELINLKR